MGQEAGKPAQPKPRGRYRTSRRSGRRCTFFGFRPSLNRQDREERQHNEDGRRLEFEDVQNENSLCMPSAEVSSGLLDEPLLENTGTGEPICQSVPSQTFEANMSPFPSFSYGLEGNQISGNLMNPYEICEDLEGYACGGHDLIGQNGISFVNINSYEPDSNDEEENDAQETFSLAREDDSFFQETVGNMFSEREKGTESFPDLESQLSTLSLSVSRERCEGAGAMPLMRYFSTDSELACPNNKAFKPSAEDQAIPKSNLSGANCEIQETKNSVDVGIGTPVAIADVLNVNDGTTDQQNPPELVVRPKIRKQTTAKPMEREKFLSSDDEEGSCSWRRTGISAVQQGRVECALRNSKEMRFSMFTDSRYYKGYKKNTEIDLRKKAAAEEQEDSTFWNEFRGHSRYFSVILKDEDSSECSDGEWSTAVPAYFTAIEKDQFSSDESWDTVPGEEEYEPEVQSSSDSSSDDSDSSDDSEEQTSLEEGEVPWLQQEEETESSSDEENYPVIDFLYAGFFLLDGNNNLEDDSSVGEDLEMEWRLVDEVGEDLELAEAIPYMNPQMLTFMTLEGHLQQAMEIALAYLETLGLDVEQAHPPATQETIDGLPQVIITDDHDGQGQCCTICCSEFVKDEIVTELPCHHLFHKTCVTLWLQKSGTCPVCRYVLAPVLTEEAAASVSLLSDHDSGSSV
ncbi:PJA2 ligase, partial [Sagittarius serpentarius]|nr:PJA2 ligase [Sagittarius serpentarius]